MRFIIVSQSSPVRLHACLNRAAEFMGNVVPTVVWSGGDQAVCEAYGLVYNSFRAFWTQASDLRFAITSEAESLRNDGTLDPMVMVISDSHMFVRKWNPHDAWTALNTSGVLGVRLTVQKDQWMREAAWKKGNNGLPVAYGWHWGDTVGDLSIPFTLGTVYKTSDVLGPLFRCTQWNTIDEMQLRVSEDPAFRRQPKMACLPSPAIKVCAASVDGSLEIQRYLDGGIPSIAVETETISWATV